jgi:hypothetical protein
MSTYRTSLAFARLADSPLNTFSENVITKMTNNPGFTTPLVSMAALTSAQTAFADAIVNAQNGGKQATAVKNLAREALLALLRQQSAYVQSIAGEDLPLLLSSGFEPMSTNRTQIQLPKPVIDRIDNPMSTQLGLRLQPVPTAAAYEIRVRYGTSGWEAVGVFTQARSIIIEDRIPGTVYDVQARAVGGSTGYSDWSDPVSHMAM